VPRLLALIPHPDDESYSFGGTIALAARAGWECFIECASYGERGKRHDGGSTNSDDVAEARETELGASCAVLGAEPPNFWGLPDGEMRMHRGEHERIKRLFERLRPTLVLTLGADGAYGHPDHTALHRWVAETWASMDETTRPMLLFSVFPKGLFLPQWEKVGKKLGNPPNPPAEAIGSDDWHYEVPIASVRQQKLASIRAHGSQLPGGEPEAIFPPGIVQELLDEERFVDCAGARAAVVAMLRALTPGPSRDRAGEADSVHS
jgi:N-acetyl-1-D-myo-inositol-2-amino-2-deoxy-alpha-D-glucopyranoside deacetylase